MNRRDILLGASTVVAAAVAGNLDGGEAKQPATKSQVATSVGKKIQIAKDLPGYYVAPAGAGKFPAVIVLMEAFGLNKWCQGICDRLAQSGFAAIAPDFYRGTTYAYTDVQGAIGKLKSLNDDRVMADVGKTIDFLQTQSNANPNNIGVVGFCMGGRYAFLTNATYSSKIKAAISFYGGGIDPLPNNALNQKSLLPKVDAIKSPLLLIYGAEDTLIAAEEHARVTAALSKAKKRYILSVFPKAGHGFLSDRRDSYEPAAAAEAWVMTTGFFKQNLR
jgi:carboxymethylenebutenolidase